MKKLTEVDEAKVLFLEAIDWSVMRWLREKKRVRTTADKANNALWALQKEVKTKWPEDLRAAYDALQNGSGGTSRIDPELKLLAKHVKDADDEANRVHEEAEAVFAKAEKILSTSMAREGCRVTINSWELYEKAIVKAESGIRSAKATK